MKNIFSSNKFKHGTIATVLTALFIAVIIVINVIVSALGDRFPSMDIDMTPDKINSLSEMAIETSQEATYDTEILLIGKEEEYLNNSLFSGTNLFFEYSQVPSIVSKMCEANPEHISMRFVDTDLDPTVVKQYPNEDLMDGTVILRTEKRYKVVSVYDMFPAYQNQKGGYDVYNSVDGALSNALHIVNLEFVPVIAVATGHGELLDTKARTAFDDLVNDNGFDVKEFNILTDAIPEDARILMLPTPATDYALEEIEKIEEFLSDTETTKTLLVTGSPDMSDTPNLDKLLADWGLKIGDGVVVETDANKMMSQNPIIAIVDFAQEIYENTEYGYLLSIASSPVEVLFKTNDSKETHSILNTSSGAFVLTEDVMPENPETAVVSTAALSYRLNSDDGNNSKTQVIVLGDYIPLTASYITNASFSNRDLVTDVLRFTSNISDYDLGLYFEETQTQIVDIIAPFATIQMVGLYIFTVAVPCIILLIGLFVFLKRRHL